MREALNAVTVHDPKIAMLANATATPIRTAAELRRELSDHLTTGVDWIAAIGETATAGTQRYVEVGYGRVLSGLVKRIPSATGAEILTIDELPVSAATAATTAAVAS
jgi:[acyl-carrier-protein] S-malonyltransferase